MNYKQEVQEKLNQADQLLFTILEGLRDKKITVELTVDKLRQTRQLVKECEARVQLNQG
jgi:exonuclease VII small subunit